MTRSTIDIEYGFFNNMVVQRTEKKYAEICFGGKTTQIKEGIIMGAFQKDKPKKIGMIKKGKFTAKFEKIPVGGPYEFAIQVLENNKNAGTEIIKNVYVGDVWLMGGQSNMAGDGFIHEKIKSDEQIMCFYMDDTWDKADDPLHCPMAAIDNIHHVLRGQPKALESRAAIDRKRICGAGCGIAFANEMRKKLGIPVGLIACAHGGTRLKDWLPDKQKATLYSALLARVKKNSGTVAGIIWYQGESDTEYGSDALFYDRMRLLISSLRRDLKNQKLPFIQAQLSRVYNTENPYKNYLWTFIREQQRILGEQISNVSTVSTLDLDDMKDPIHLGTSSLVRLGKRMAYAASEYFTEAGEKSGYLSSGPTIKSASFRSDFMGNYVEVKIADINGSLKSNGAASGFSIEGEFGWKLPIYKTEIRKDTILLYYCNDNPREEKFYLYYGYGMMPYCNICDEKDMGLTGFGPYSLGKKVSYLEK